MPIPAAMTEKVIGESGHRGLRLPARVALALAGPYSHQTPAPAKSSVALLSGPTLEFGLRGRQRIQGTPIRAIQTGQRADLPFPADRSGHIRILLVIQ